MVKTALVINTEREGYTPNQVFKTMTVEELIDELKNYPDDMEVYLGFDRKYTFGGFEECMFQEYRYPDKDDL